MSVDVMVENSGTVKSNCSPEDPVKYTLAVILVVPTVLLHDT